MRNVFKIPTCTVLITVFIRISECMKSRVFGVSTLCKWGFMIFKVTKDLIKEGEV